MNSLSALAEKDWYYQPIMNVHDDLTSIFPEKNFDEYVETKLNTLLTKKYDFLNVPLMVELKIGPNLCDMQEIANYESHTWRQH
jgi:DNA polymerase I-like protein with 3'-5' exonuclease and polymerase domains